MYNPNPLQAGMQGQFVPGYGVPGLPLTVLSSPNETTLYIGNLSPLTKDDRLGALLRQNPETSAFTSLRIMKDAYTGGSRRFGFISYSTIEDAQKAKDLLNYTKLDNFEIRLCFKRAKTEFNENANLFVKNIKKATTAKQLDELFSQCGKIVSCSIRTNDKGDSLGYAYIQFELEESALKAIQKFDKNETVGEPLTVEKFVPSKNRAVSKNNVYMKHFPKTYTEEQVHAFVTKHAAKIGPTVSIGIKKKVFSDTQTCYYAFAAFEKEEDALKMIAELNGNKIDLVTGELVKSEVQKGENEGEKDAAKAESVEETLCVCLCEPKKLRNDKLSKEHNQQINNTALFVMSLLETATEAEVRAIFGKYGQVGTIFLKTSQPPYFPNGQVVQSAIVNFKDEQGATNALLEFKKNDDLRKLIHPLHKKTLDFVTYHQNKAFREDYKRMRNRLVSNMYQEQNRFMNPSFFKNRPFNAMNFGPSPMFMNPQMNQFGQPRGFQGHSNTPQTNKNSQSESTSRHGDEEEVFTLDLLKSKKAEFLKFDKEKQQNILGNLMYHRIVGSSLVNKSLAPKITGMLIDMDILDFNEIIDIMENKENLEERIEEALEVIESNAEE